MKYALALVVTALLLNAGMIAQDPEFDTEVMLEVGYSYVAEDWTEEDGGGLNPFIGMAYNGFRVQPTNTEGNVAIAQYKGTYTPATGRNARVEHRIHFDHPQDMYTKFGFYSATLDPFAVESCCSATLGSVVCGHEPQ